MKLILISIIALTCGAQASSFEADDAVSKKVGFPLVRTSPLRVPTTFPPHSPLYLEVLERNHTKSSTPDDESEHKRPDCVPPLRLPDTEKPSA